MGGKRSDKIADSLKCQLMFPNYVDDLIQLRFTQVCLILGED